MSFVSKMASPDGVAEFNLFSLTPLTHTYSISATVSKKSSRIMLTIKRELCD